METISCGVVYLFSHSTSSTCCSKALKHPIVFGHVKTIAVPAVVFDIVVFGNRISVEKFVNVMDGNEFLLFRPRVLLGPRGFETVGSLPLIAFVLFPAASDF